MTIESEYKLKFAIEGWRFYACQKCLAIVAQEDRKGHRSLMHSRVKIENSGPTPSWLGKAPPRCLRCRNLGPAADEKWWKCCPEHTTSDGPDGVCTPCANAWHPEGLGSGKLIE